MDVKVFLIREFTQKGSVRLLACRKKDKKRWKKRNNRW